MKVQILKTTVADKRFVRAGSIEEISDADARALILLGKAVAYDGQVSQPAPVELNSETAAPLVSEDKPRRGRKAKN